MRPALPVALLALALLPLLLGPVLAQNVPNVPLDWAATATIQIDKSGLSKTFTGAMYTAGTRNRSRSELSPAEGGNELTTITRFDLGASFTITTSSCFRGRLQFPHVNMFFWLAESTFLGPTTINGVSCMQYSYGSFFACLTAPNVPFVFQFSTPDLRTSYMFEDFQAGPQRDSLFTVPKNCD